MSRKARERLMHGTRRAEPGQVVYGHQDPRRTSRGVMLGVLRVADKSEREVIRRRLRQDGSVRALALLGVLEKHWGSCDAAL